MLDDLNEGSWFEPERSTRWGQHAIGAGDLDYWGPMMQDLENRGEWTGFYSKGDQEANEES